jgi:hypothetical protein
VGNRRFSSWRAAAGVEDEQGCLAGAAAGGYDARALHGRMLGGQVSLRYSSGCRRRVAGPPSPDPARR